jgi:hypothetical protein
MAALGFEYLTLRTFSSNNEIANVARRPSGAVAGPGSPELVAVG